MALNITRADSSKGSNRGKFESAGWNNNFFTKLLASVRNAIALAESLLIFNFTLCH